MQKIKHLSTFILLFFLSCNQDNAVSDHSASKNGKTASNNTTIITIQPFSDFPQNELVVIVKELKKIYPLVAVNKPIAMPKSTLNKAKTRHRADSLIQFLSDSTSVGNVTIGLTTQDISTTLYKSEDWGVMGLGFCPGKACIASSFRLKGDNKFEKFFKVALHELGHTRGLPHCPIKTCFMRDAKVKGHWDEQINFCPSCKKVLVKAGWNLK